MKKSLIKRILSIVLAVSVVMSLSSVSVFAKEPATSSANEEVSQATEITPRDAGDIPVYHTSYVYFSATPPMYFNVAGSYMTFTASGHEASAGATTVTIQLQHQGLFGLWSNVATSTIPIDGIARNIFSNIKVSGRYRLICNTNAGSAKLYQNRVFHS